MVQPEVSARHRAAFSSLTSWHEGCLAGRQRIPCFPAWPGLLLLEFLFALLSQSLDRTPKFTQ